MMTARNFISLLLLTSASAFGPHSRVQNVKNTGGMTMRVGTNDLLRRQRFNKILHTVQPNPTQESVENVLLSEGTSKLIEKCNWKLRKTMIRKVKIQADRFDIEMNQQFGQPMSYDVRVEIEKSIGEANRAKKVAAAKQLLEETVQKAEIKAKKQAAKEAAKVEATKAKASKAEAARTRAEADAAKTESVVTETEEVKEVPESIMKEEVKVEVEPVAKEAKEAAKTESVVAETDVNEFPEPNMKEAAKVEVEEVEPVAKEAKEAAKTESVMADTEEANEVPEPIKKEATVEEEVEPVAKEAELEETSKEETIVKA